MGITVAQDNINDTTLLAFCLDARREFAGVPRAEAFCHYLGDFVRIYELKSSSAVRVANVEKAKARFRENMQADGVALMESLLPERKGFAPTHDNHGLMVEAAVNHMVERLRPGRTYAVRGQIFNLSEGAVEQALAMNHDMYGQFLNGVRQVVGNPQHIITLG